MFLLRLVMLMLYAYYAGYIFMPLIKLAIDTSAEYVYPTSDNQYFLQRFCVACYEDGLC